MTERLLIVVAIFTAVYCAGWLSGEDAGRLREMRRHGAWLQSFARRYATTLEWLRTFERG